ncbi:oligosaccharide repeat unit polymerase [Flavobacterium hiemivividum]|uniref:Oligosaccharide repeat unit polymerase n=2 Tax=Flavobacterium hiemivividum TaxID=2541734 RepID=A0A4R5D2Y5_9FLAO|nr:oligosaccharide repeat unit polymerase [Flavobacterium hiemivividum]
MMKKRIQNIKRISLFVGYSQCFFLLMLYAILFLIKNDIILIISFVYSLLVGFLTIKSRANQLLLNNSLAILLVFIFLYGFFNSVIEFFLLGEITEAGYYATIIYATTVPSYVIGSGSIKSTNYDVTYTKTIENKKYSKLYSVFLLIMLIVFLLYKSYSFYSRGMFFNPSLLKTVSRLELTEGISQLGIVTGLMITSIFLYFTFYYKLLPSRVKLIVFGCLLYYIALQSSVGNRRDFVPMLIGVFWVFINFKKIKFTLGWFLLMLVSIFLFLFLGSLRAEAGSDEGFNYLQVAIDTLSNNEFVYPFYTLKLAVYNYLNGTIDFFYGKTIFIDSFLNFIPRSIYTSKPNSLAVQFVMDNFGGGMGYAYSPVAESFVNFGLFGPSVVFFLLGSLISKLQEFRDQRFIFVFFTMIPDFCRGEFSSFFYQFWFVALFIIIIPMINRELFGRKSVVI